MVDVKMPTACQSGKVGPLDKRTWLSQGMAGTRLPRSGILFGAKWMIFGI